jgi:integrase
VSSLTRRPNGHIWIIYRFNRKRHTIRLGKAFEDIAQEFQRRLDTLIEHRSAGMEPPADIAAWVSKIDGQYHANLVTAGLAPPRGPSTLGELAAAHLQSLIAKGSKTSTLVNNRIVHGNLITHFGESRRLSAITPQNAESFFQHLTKAGGREGGPLAKATVSNRCRRARAVFAYAIRNGWTSENPFRDIATGGEWNYERDHYILAEVFSKILDATTDHELRLLLALVRYCGLRCPSEVKPLTWQHVDWTNGLLVVHSSKTERYGDSGRREVPLFPAILPYLYAHRETCPEKVELIFPRHQGSGSAITGRLAALCRKSGEVLWPKAMVNLRASAERDAMQANNDIHTVAAWFGHSPEIALRHYNRVVKERKARAASNALRPAILSVDPNPNPKFRSDPSRTPAN